MLRRVASMWLALPAWRAGLLIAVCCLAVYGPGMLLLPTIDRDEARFAQASRQMLEAVTLDPAERDPDLHRGSAVLPMVGGTERLNKPPTIYWLQATSAGLLTLGQPRHDAVWMYRLPSLIAAIVAVLALWHAARARFGPRVALLAALMLAACPLFAWEARQARADMVLVAATTLAMAALWAHFDGRGRRWHTPVLLWGAIAVGVLTKGPVILLVVGSAALFGSIATRRWRWLLGTQPWLGLILVSATIGPWLYAVGELVGHAEFWQRIKEETLGRSLEPAEGHAGPPGYHLVLSAALFWPGAALAGKEFLGAVARLASSTVKRRAHHRGLLFLSAWLIPTWLVMELISTKLPHYVLPLYPALAVLSARAIVVAQRSRLNPSTDLGLSIGIGLWRWLGLILLVGVPIAFAALLGWVWWPIALAVLVALGGLPPHPVRTDWFTLQQRALLAAGVFALLVPVGLALSPRIHLTRQLTDALGEPLPELVAAEGYHEDSLVFATRGTLVRLSEGESAGFMTGNPQAVVVVPADRAPEGARVIATVEGFNYSRGRTQSLAVVRTAEVDP